MAAFCPFPMGSRYVDSVLENGPNPVNQRRTFCTGIEPTEFYNVLVYREWYP
jgi:hypothetical protein